MTIRIGHCIHGLGLGGAQEVIKTLVAGTASEGVEHIVYSCEDGVFRKRIEDVGGVVRIVPRRLPKLDPFWITHLAHAMQSDRIDLVHTHLFGDSLHGVVAGRKAGRPTLMTLHLAFRNLPALQRHGYVWLLHRATRVVACSEEVARSFRPSVDASVEIRAIPNGVEDPTIEVSPIEARRRLGLPEQGLIVATIGRLAKEKGIDLLLAAFAELQPENRRVRLVVVGDGDERESLLDKARVLGLRERITFAGERSDVRELLPGFDVVASSSLGEGLPLTLLESMSAGRALVWTDVDGVGEAVRDEREALLVPSRDVLALTAALERVLSDEALRERLGHAARERFTENFTSSRMVRAYREVYGSMSHANTEVAGGREAA